jgi:predicted DsbA family dithiol-disulfide isomerase
MKSTPTLHVWHDYVRPFCNVEATRIMRIKEADNLTLDVRFHPWPLEVANGTQPRAEDEDT